MADSDTDNFTCTACRQRFPWNPQRAGKKLLCQCGNLMTVPDWPDPEEYPVDEEPPVARKSPVPAQRVVEYRRPGAEVVQGPASMEDLVGSLRRDFLIPLAIVLIGTAGYYAFFAYIANSPARAMGSASVRMGLNVAVTLALLVLARRVFDLELSAPASLVVKAAAVAILPNAAGAWVLLLPPACLAVPLALVLNVSIYCVLLMVFFEMSHGESFLCTVLLWLIGGVALFLLSRLAPAMIWLW